MASIKFSASHVAALPAKQRSYVDYDPDLPGFGVRIAPRGTRSWIVEFRPNGGGRKQPTQRMTIGHVSSLTLAKARERARTILAEVRLGGDPARERKDRREAVTVAELADLFMKHAECVWQYRIGRKPTNFPAGPFRPFPARHRR